MEDLKCLNGRVVTRGRTRGEAVVTEQPFMFTHALDPSTGRVIDRKHELFGVELKSKIFIFPYPVGSTSAGMWLLEAIRVGNAPLALVLEKIDPVLATGAVLADIMLGKPIPIVDKFNTSPVKVFQTGEIIQVDADKGEVSLCLHC
ncbi:MAG: DUF126 domain-containing protein [Deltaproteobacteria bacterium]|nr:DUF126 domain-containing protein [Deltaproteobacteria bacterium]